MPDLQDGEGLIPLFSEELAISKRVVETGSVVVTRITREQSVPIEEPLAEETIEISREPIGRHVETLPLVRQEGDTIVVPIVEEQLVIGRRLFLKEEVRIRRVRSTRTHRDNVPLRRHEVIVSTAPAHTAPANDSRGMTTTPINEQRGGTMRYQTVVAAFDNRAFAQAAADALKTAGFHADDISVLDKTRVATESGVLAGKSAGLWQRLFGPGVLQHEAVVYDQAVERGGSVVSVRVPEYEVAHATGILDLHHPIDVRDRALTTGVVPAPRAETIVAATAPVPMAVAQAVAVSPKLAEISDKVLRLAEEQLQVGKRMIETGKTRVRRFITERDVSADVTLHEEHAEVLRRAVADPKYVGKVDWADSTIELTETAEQALVSKTARVVEEISLKKIGSDHVQTLHEKVRRQQVEIDRLDAEGKRVPEMASAGSR